MPKISDPVKILESKAKSLEVLYIKLDAKYNEVKEKRRETKEELEKVLAALKVLTVNNEEKDQVLRQDSSPLLVEAPGGGPHGTNTAEEIPPQPRPACPACLTEGSLYNSQKAFSQSGKSIPITVCMECSYETLGHRV